MMTLSSCMLNGSGLIAYYWIRIDIELADRGHSSFLDRSQLLESDWRPLDREGSMQVAACISSSPARPIDNGLQPTDLRSRAPLRALTLIRNKLKPWSRDSIAGGF
jgi:hypothetical protein